MKKRIHFFAAADDLVPVLESVERGEALRYTVFGNHVARENTNFLRGVDLPDLGRATKDASAKCPRYVVTMRDAPVVPEFFRLNTGEGTYSTSQLTNPDSVVLLPAGLRHEDVVLEGFVATVSDTPDAQRLMTLFSKAFRPTFKKISSVLVGPRALALLADGARLAPAVQSPPEYNLPRASSSN